MAKTKVAEIILDLASRAGAETFFESLCLNLAKSNEVELYIISLWDNIHESFSRLKNLEDVHFYSLGKRKGIDFKAAKRMRKIIKDINPDIIHTHRSILLTYYLAFGARKRNWKIVHTIHNIPTKESNSLTNHLRKKFIKKDAIEFVGISDTITQQFKNLFDTAKITTINNGIPLEDPKIYNNPTYDFINVARFSEQKNHRLLFDAFDVLAKDNKFLRLICVGNGELLEQSKEYVATLGCKEQITLYGPTNDVYSLLADSKYFVLSSLYEGNPISVLEAMNCGLPIIAPGVGGIPDVIENEKNGLLFEVGNLESLVAAMKRIIASKELTETISANNLSDIKKYSIEYCTKQYIDLFKDIVSKDNK